MICPYEKNPNISGVATFWCRKFWGQKWSSNPTGPILPACFWRMEGLPTITLPETNSSQLNCWGPPEKRIFRLEYHHFQGLKMVLGEFSGAFAVRSFLGRYLSNGTYFPQVFWELGQFLLHKFQTMGTWPKMFFRKPKREWFCWNIWNHGTVFRGSVEAKDGRCGFPSPILQSSLTKLQPHQISRGSSNPKNQILVKFDIQPSK